MSKPCGASQTEMMVLSDLDFKGATKGRAHPHIGKWVTVDTASTPHVFLNRQIVSSLATKEQRVSWYLTTKHSLCRI